MHGQRNSGIRAIRFTVRERIACCFFICPETDTRDGFGGPPQIPFDVPTCFIAPHLIPRKSRRIIVLDPMTGVLHKVSAPPLRGGACFQHLKSAGTKIWHPIRGSGYRKRGTSLSILGTDEFAIARNLGKTNVEPPGVSASDFLKVADVLVSARCGGPC
jgi:hypothetical protein